MTKVDPIYTGDEFRSPSGDVYEVTRTLPGGKVDCIIRKSVRQCTRTHADLRSWEKITKAGAA